MRQAMMGATAAIGLLGLGSIVLIALATLDGGRPVVAPVEADAAIVVPAPLAVHQGLAPSPPRHVATPPPVAPRAVGAAPSIAAAYVPGPPTLGAALAPDSVDPLEVQNLAYSRSFGRGGGGRR